MFQRVCTALALLLCLAAAGLAQSKPPANAAAAAAPSLYKRLGGYDAIAAVMDDFLAQMAQDKQLSRFLVGLSDSSKGRLRQLAVEQLCQAAGGPCVYVGRDTKTAHKGLGITGSDWDLAVKALVASLDKFKVPAAEKNELLGLVSSLKPDIVEKP
ncbi:MAG TPA: group 1 truncated hemoglobin [Thermoanaerobaculia bacterium]|jgi:hemoglobin|nr:group 1 truncated hemoglobin [Thermoanaerobaculia bacterium]